MLPDFLSGSYQRYKQDTALFTTWLAKAAASVGYKPEALRRQQDHAYMPGKIAAAAKKQENIKPSARLKGKDRKAAKAKPPKQQQQRVMTIRRQEYLRSSTP